MIKQSIRIFCVDEIYDMVRKKEYSKDFLEYVKSAPNNIKEWLRKIGMDESLPEMRYIAEPEVHSAGESEVRSDAESEVHSAEEPEARSDAEPEVHSAEEPEVRSDAEPEVHSAVEIAAGTDAVPESVGKPADPDNPVGPDARSDSDLYSGMRFGDKIQVERLVLHEMTGTKCSIHLKPYQRIKVVCSIGVKTFSIRTYCCPKCCKLYMKTGNFKGIQPILKNRNVNYVWIPAEEVAK